MEDIKEKRGIFYKNLRCSKKRTSRIIKKYMETSIKFL